MKCICYEAPMGRNNLEGFELSSEYEYSILDGIFVIDCKYSVLCDIFITEKVFIAKKVFNKYFVDSDSVKKCPICEDYIFPEYPEFHGPDYRGCYSQRELKEMLK